MKYIFVFFVIMPILVSAQSASVKFKADALKDENISPGDVKAEITRLDIGGLLTRTQNTSVMGFIGTNYQRIRVKLISVIRNNATPEQYFIYGKTMVKDNVCEFQGILKITAAYYFKVGEADGKQGFMLGDYTFYEDPAQKHAGQFKGSCRLAFYFDKQGKIQYDNIMGSADGFSNNEFVGTWTGYGATTSKPCHWGDSHIPVSGDLDTGSGEFSPNEKYIANGWQNYKDAYFGAPGAIADDAKRKKAQNGGSSYFKNNS